MDEDTRFYVCPISEGAVRDFIISLDRPVAPRELQDEFWVTSQTVRRYLKLLEGKGVLSASGSTRDRRYVYVPPPENAPNVRPRGEPHVPGVGAARKTGEVTPRASRTVGPSGKPGRDKRAAALGHRVKRKRVGT